MCRPQGGLVIEKNPGFFGGPAFALRPGAGCGRGGICAAVVAGIPESGKKLRARRSVTGGLPGREKYAIVKSGFCELLFICSY